MPDKENIIKAWECCNPFNRKCNECPYEKDCYHDGISRHMVADAIALLKELEGYVSVPFSWLVKFCSHIDFAEPLTDAEREMAWRQKLEQQFGINVPKKDGD